MEQTTDTALPTIGRAVRAWREYRGIRATDLAQMTGIRKEYLSHLENERILTPRDEVIAGLAAALSVPVADVLARRLPPAPAEPPGPASSPIPMVEVYRRLTANRNDAEALNELLSVVSRLARRNALNPSDIEDVAAETLLDVLSRLDHVRTPDGFKGFVVGSYFNVRNRYLRRAHREASGFPGVRTSVHDPTDDESGGEARAIDLPDATDLLGSYVRAEELASLRACVESLPQREQFVVVTYYRRTPDDDPRTVNTDLAKELGVSERTVRSIRASALQHLRKCLASRAPTLAWDRLIADVKAPMPDGGSPRE